jgi:sugar lactone lactonase YvrE
MSGEAVACTTRQDALGEGIRWDARRDELLRVDIPAGLVYRERVADDGSLVAVRTYDVGGSVGAINPIDGDDGWLLALDQGIAHLAPDGVVRPLLDLAPPDVKMNDAACDPQGRLWAGTISDRDGAAALYRLDADGRSEIVVEGLTISNGLGWSLDGRTMYLADSTPGTVTAFDFDGERGTVANARVLIRLAEEEGMPDGLTVDAEGDLWIAIWGGSSVRRYGPDGALRGELRVPAVETTSCGFAGRGLTRLYVTTATENWTEAQRRAEPGAGRVYRFETDAVGQPAAAFRPDPDWWASVMAR